MYVTLPFLSEDSIKLDAHVNEEVGKSQNGNESIQSSKMEEKSFSVNTSLPYQRLLENYEHLVKANIVLQKLIAEFIKGNSINSIIKEFYNLTELSGVIYNVHGHIIASVGVESLSKGLSRDILFQYIGNRSVNTPIEAVQMIKRSHDCFYFISKAFFLNEKKAGYCCVILKEDDEPCLEFVLKLIEQLSIVCSLVFLNEKTKIDSSEQMKSIFLKDIITGQFNCEDEMIAKAGLFQFNLRRPFYICFLGYEFDQNNFPSEVVFGREMIECIKFLNHQNKIQMLINHEGHHIYLFVNKQFNDGQEKKLFFTSFIDHLAARFPGSHFYMGISSQTDTILKAPNAYKEAKMAKRMITSHKQVIFYESLGMIGSLLNQQNEHEVRSLAHALLNHLDYNDQKNFDLVKTLYFFLVNGGNLEKTAEELSLSISGLRYRVQKMEEVLQKDVRNPVNSCQLLMAIQALILLGDLEINNILEY